MTTFPLQVDNPRVFSEEEFLYLCTSYEQDRSIPENIGRNQNFNTSNKTGEFRHVATSNVTEIPHHPSCFFTATTSVRGPTEEIYQGEVKKGETDLDSEMSDDSFTPYASDTIIHSDREPSCIGTMIQDEGETLLSVVGNGGYECM